MPRWLAETGRNEKAEAAIRRFERAQPLETRAILQPAETPSALDPDKHPWPVLGGIFFLSPWATVVFPILGGAVLLQKGFALSQALFLVGTAMIGPVIGTLASAFVFDRLTRRGALVLCAVGMLISSVLFALASGPVTLLISSMAFGVFAAVYVPGLNLFASELFTTRKRAGATSTLWAINRVGSAAGPLVLTPLFAEFGATPFFTGIALTLICIAGLFLFAPVGRARRAVD